MKIGARYNSKQYRNDFCLHREIRRKVERKDLEKVKINAHIFYIPHLSFAIHLFKITETLHSKRTSAERRMRSQFCVFNTCSFLK